MLTDDEIKTIADSTATAEPGTEGYILPFSFARAIIAATIYKLAAGVPDLVDSAKDEHGHCIMCGIHPASVQAYLTTAIAAARFAALEEAALMAEGHYGDGHRLAEEIRALKGTP